MYRPLLLFGYLFVYIVSDAECKQSFYAEPQDTIVNPGQVVSLTCKVSNREGACMWVKDTTIIGEINGKYVYERKPTNGDCSLQILDANLDVDDGTWQCQVTAARLTDRTIVSTSAKVTVRERPSPPYLEDSTIKIPTDNGKFSVKAGEVKKVHCFSRKGNPPAVIKWFIDDVDVTDMSTQTNISDVEKKKTYQASSVLAYVYDKEHNARTLKCSALHDLYPEKSLAVVVTLNVMYAPTIMFKNVPKGDIIENSHLEVQCVADANPEASVMWLKAGNYVVIHGVGETLKFEEVNRKDSGVYSCSAKNSVGDSEVLEFTLDVKYPPKIISVHPSIPQTVSVGSKTNLTCLAEGNPAPEYHWIQKWEGNPPKYKDVSRKPQLLVKNTTYEYQGKYVCRVRNKISSQEHEDQSLEIQLDVKGPPQVLASSARTKQNIVIEEEEDVTLTVFFCSDPPPSNTYWEWGSLKLSSGTPRGRFKAERLLKDQGSSDCFESRLNIEKTTGSDARKYTFNIENERGRTAYAVELEIRQPVAVSMVIGIVVGCIVLLVIVILLVVYAFKAEKFCFKHSGTHNFKTDTDSEMGAGNTDTVRTNASSAGAIPPDAVYTTPSMATPPSSNNNSHNENGNGTGHYENVRADRDDRRNKDGLVYADLDLKPFDRRGQGSGGRFRGSGSKPRLARPEREPIEYAEIQFQPKVTEQADL